MKFKPDADPAQQTTPTEPTVWKDPVTYMDDMNYHHMAEQMDISYEDRRDLQIAEKLSFLADWAKDQTKSEDRLQHALALKQLTRTLGLSMTGNDLVKKLYAYTRLDMDRKRIEQKMSLLK